MAIDLEKQREGWRRRAKRSWAKNGERIKAQNRGYRKADPLRFRGYELKKHYGITLADYEAMLASQGGVCAACATFSSEKGHPYLHVDHDHATNTVRALLCHGCNKALGYLKEDPDRIRKLAVYAESQCVKLRAV